MAKNKWHEIHRVAFYSIDAAFHQDLIRLTKWLVPSKDNVSYLHQEYIRISSDHERKTLLVCNDSKVALFVNPVAGTSNEEDEDEDFTSSPN